MFFKKFENSKVIIIITNICIVRYYREIDNLLLKNQNVENFKKTNFEHFISHCVKTFDNFENFALFHFNSLSKLFITSN